VEKWQYSLALNPCQCTLLAAAQHIVDAGDDDANKEGEQDLDMRTRQRKTDRGVDVFFERVCIHGLVISSHVQAVLDWISGRRRFLQFCECEEREIHKLRTTNSRLCSRVSFPCKIPNSRRVRKTQSLVGFATQERMLLAAQKPDPTAIQCQRMLMTQRRVHSSKSGTKHRKRHYQCQSKRLRIFYYAIILLQASQNRSPASDAPFFHEFSSSDAADAAASEDFDLMTVGLFCFVFI